MSKMNFKKLKKKHYFDAFESKKHFEKQPLSHFQNVPSQLFSSFHCKMMNMCMMNMSARAYNFF